MNKRDFLKGSAAFGTALAATPAILPSLGQAATATATKVARLLPASPVPVYSYDSVRRVMTFYRSDDGTRAMHAYFAGA